MPNQSPISYALDFVDAILQDKESAKENKSIALSYSVFAIIGLVVWRCLSDRDFSTVLSLGSGIQALGFWMLLSKMRMQKSAAGVSSKTLQMYVLVLIFRLVSTTVKNGYLPVDRTGDWVYQTLDGLCLMLIFMCLFQMHRGALKSTYQSGVDSMPIFRAVPVCFLLALTVRGNMNRAPFYDISWYFALYLDNIAMLPQLWMLVADGEVEALTSHYIAAVGLKSICSFSFWWHGYRSVAPKDGGFNIGGYLIMASYGLQILLSADFLYHYITWGTKGGRGGLVLPGTLRHDI